MRTRVVQVVATAVGLSIVGAFGLPALLAAAAPKARPVRIEPATSALPTDGPAAWSDPATWDGQLPNGRVYQPPASIAADCSKDVAPALNRWIATVPSNSTIQFGKKACYETEETVAFRQRSNIIVDGQGSTFRRMHLSAPNLQYPIPNPHLLFVNMTNLIIRNIHVKGTDETSDVRNVPWVATYNQRYEFESGFNIEGGSDVRLTDSTTEGTWGDGAYISGNNQYSGNPSRNVTVQNLSVYKNGRGGIVITDASHVLVAGSTIVFGRRSGINMEPDFSNSVVDSVEIRDSRITAYFPAFDSAGKGSVNNILIHDNTVPYAGVPFVYDKASDGHRRTNWTVRDNHVLGVLGSPMPAMLFANTTGVVVARNVVPLEAQQYMAGVGLVNGSTAAQVHCNWFKNAMRPLALDKSSSAKTFDNAMQLAPPDCPTPRKK